MSLPTMETANGLSASEREMESYRFQLQAVTMNHVDVLE